MPIIRMFTPYSTGTSNSDYTRVLIMRCIHAIGDRVMPFLRTISPLGHVSDAIVTSDPNRDDDPTYIIHLIKKVASVSVESGLV